MAASGTNEHHEACRKQNFINRQTYLKKQIMAEADGQDNMACQAAMEEEIQRKLGSTPGHLGPLSSYDLEKLHRKHGSMGTDEERRRAVRQSQYLTYTAKINGRLSSVNYQQQW
ncbi:hypothetical protein EGW08_001067 [Elysia chlorotica]|uniref:Uncharacterized protein n=1 Tax=Elysia chlorotica TaxID=188477 RepID=A0A433UBH9_ELYCH|nr:hypothetical protein EGW08_001067 [Elysia chlorotica]